MIKCRLSICLLLLFSTASAQENRGAGDEKQGQSSMDDPSRFISRMELFNELHRFDKNDFYLDITTFRTLIKIGKRFSTRLDLPFVYNSLTTTGDYSHYGLGDISLRLLGYKISETKKGAVTLSMEVSMNTASSPLLGTGKNMLIPMVTYSRVLTQGKSVLSLVFQQVNSVGGDPERATQSYSKIQPVLINLLSKHTWTVVSPECFIDYVHGGVSMNLETRLAHAVTPRVNVALQLGVGLFGDFYARYTWFAGIGGRYFLFREGK